ncbi:hypothetical protein ACFL0H_06515 [Thermodesulfobacteriota bacterium]
MEREDIKHIDMDMQEKKVAPGMQLPFNPCNRVPVTDSVLPKLISTNTSGRCRTPGLGGTDKVCDGPVRIAFERELT